MQALILTGGLGTRLRPLTLEMPKPLLPIVNTPFLSYQLSLLRKHKVDTAVLCMADSEKPYKNLIAQQAKLGTTVHSSREFQELGTAGAIKNAEKFADSPMLFVFNGDVLTNLDLTAMIRFHHEKKAFITVALTNVPDPSPYGLAVMDASHGIKRFVEKPDLKSLKKQKTYPINAGTYLMHHKIFDLIPKRTKYSVEKQLFPDCLAQGLPIFGFLPKGDNYWLDIGTPQKYFQANQDIITHHLFKFSNDAAKKRISKTAVIHKTASVSSETVIGEASRIGPNCVLNRCVILDHVAIDEECRLEDCIVGGRSKIGHHVNVQGLRVIGPHSVLTPYSRL